MCTSMSATAMLSWRFVRSQGRWQNGNPKVLQTFWRMGGLTGVGAGDACTAHLKRHDMCEIVDISENWECEFMTFIVVWQLRVKLDNSCDVWKPCGTCMSLMPWGIGSIGIGRLWMGVPSLVNHGRSPVFSRGDGQVTELGRTVIFTKLFFLRCPSFPWGKSRASSSGRSLAISQHFLR